MSFFHNLIVETETQFFPVWFWVSLQFFAFVFITFTIKLCLYFPGTKFKYNFSEEDADFTK